MEHSGSLDRRMKILHTMSSVPQMMLALRHRHNMYEFVLHDLCSCNCFNLHRAAYLVDSPAFNCLRGVAGYASDEVAHAGSCWKEPDLFSEKMERSSFNKQVKSLTHDSVCGSCQDAAVRDLAGQLGLADCAVCHWDMIYENHGLFMYEKADPDDDAVEDYLLSGLSLLTFCPVF